MIDVWLVRHGEAAASWGEHPDPGLSELGRSQAELACEELRELVPENVELLSSPKARAQETGEPLSKTLVKAMRIHDAFIEIQSPVPLSERQGWLQGFMRDTWESQPDTIWAWRNGIIDALESLDRPTVIFSHFLVINAVHAHCSGQDPTLQLWPDNGSIHHVRVSDQGIEWVSTGRQMASHVN